MTRAPAVPPLVQALREAFAAHADAARAGPMQAYMKSALPFRGIPAPERRRLMAQAVAQHPAPDTAALAAAMQALWRQARWREERYAAMELARVGPHRRLLSTTLLPLYEEMISSGAWWDYADDISGHALGDLLRTDAQAVKAVLRRWSTGEDLWLRRSAMLAQRRLPVAQMDAALLYALIEPSLAEPRWGREFFIAKGMGWALRERAYQAPQEVQAYCEREAARLPALTRREALKGLRRLARA